MKAFFLRRPVTAALLIWLADFGIQLLGAALFKVVAPQVPDLIQRLALLLLLCAGTAALVAGLGAWGGVGYNSPSRWRNLHLLWLPLLLSFLPLIGGVQALDAGTIAIFVVGYLATGFMEEMLFRGVIFSYLRKRGIGRAVAISSISFGLLHISRLFIGSAPMTVAWQVRFAMCFGVALCALRLRTGTIWPLILLHALWDFVLNSAHLPPLLYPVVHLVLLGYGRFLLRRGVALAPADDGDGEEPAEALQATGLAAG